MLAALLLPLLFATQVAPSPPAPVPGPAPAKPVRGLGSDEAAWIDNAQVITLADLDLYLATVEARKPAGQEALLQVLQEAIVDREAAKAGFTASEGEIDDALRTLDAQAGGLAKALRADVDMAGLRNAVRLHVLHDPLLREARHMAPRAPAVPAARAGAPRCAGRPCPRRRAAPWPARRPARPARAGRRRSRPRSR